MICRTNKLKSEAAPSVLDFSSYSVACTDRPAQSTSKVVALHRKLSAQHPTILAEQREVPLTE